MDPISVIGGGVSSVLWFIIPFLIVLSVVVFIHEMGHFLAARFFGVKVDAFSIGFGRELFAWVDRHGTRWRLAMLPLGGYVRFWGDADATTARADPATTKSLTPEQRAWSFHHKPLYQKAIISAAGPMANFILSLTLFAGLAIFVGERIVPPVFGSVEEGSPAARAGLKRGDRVLEINGTPIRTYVDFAKMESLGTGTTLTLKIERDGETFFAPVAPRLVDEDDGQGGKVALPRIGVEAFVPPFVSSVEVDSPAARAGVKKDDLIVSVNGKDAPNFNFVRTVVAAGKTQPVILIVDRDGTLVTFTITPAVKTGRRGQTQYLLGIGNDPRVPNPRYKVETVYHDPISAIGRAAGETWFIVKKIGEFLGQLVTGTGDYRQLSGPIGIAKVSSDVAQVSLASLVQLIAVLSVSIGVLNLLPIPILDGGHLLYYAIEGVRGRPLGEGAQELGFRIGLVFVLGLMFVATFNDIVKVPGWLF